MTDPESIKKNKPGDNLFETLRQEGIEHIQDLCGKVWTDYNLHDPGITILEQFCYAMTELSYRTDFDVADILAGQDNSIDFQNLALFPPQEIFPNQALTPRDYEKMIFDTLPEIEDIWVGPDRSTETPGLYQIRFMAKEGGIGSGSMTDPLVESVKQVFCKARNLCEDVSRVHRVQNRYCSLHANIEITGHQNPARVLAEIYQACASHISPGITYDPYDLLVQKGKTPGEIFTGPLLNNGFIRDTPPVRDQAFITIGDLLILVRAVKGVASVKSLSLRDPLTGQTHGDAIGREEAGAILCLEIPEKEEQISVSLSKNLRPYLISLNELTRQYSRLTSTRELGLSKEEIDKSRQLPSGRSTHLGQYESIMDQFPNAYGINRFGIPSSYPDAAKAKAKQLKAYLLLFEQPMANFLETLDRTSQLFSLDPDLDRTAFARLLDNTNAPDIEDLYIGGKGACARKLDRVTKKYDPFHDRRNRILDYLLALYGEKFTQNSLGAYNYYYSESALAHQFILNKIKFLKHLPEISAKRAAAYNYRETSWNTENIAGLKLKASILLGFQFHHSRSLTIAFTKHGLALIPDKKLADLDQGRVEIRYVEPGDIKEKIKNPFKRVRFARQKKKLEDREIRQLFRKIVFLKNNLLNESFLINGLDADNYRIGRFSDNTWQIIFKPHNQSRWCYLSSYRHRESALLSATHLRYFVKTLNIMSEGLHLVEHLLLRPSDGQAFPDIPDDFFPFRISVVFPSWTARCADSGFRRLAEETVRLNAPAHIAIDFYWLDFQAMLEFEILYHDWLENKKKGPGTETDGLANGLIQFFMTHRPLESSACYL
jgi:hypothetical protein